MACPLAGWTSEASRAEWHVAATHFSDIETLRYFTQALSDAGLLIDDAGRIRHVNDAAVRLFGHAPGALLGQGVECLVPHHLRTVHQAHRAHYARDPSRRMMGGSLAETPGLKASGEVFEAKVSLSPLAGGYVLVTVVDLSVMRQAREALRKCSLIVEQMASAVIITDANGLIEHVNPGFVHCTGYEAAEVVGRTPGVLKSGFTPAQVYVSLWRSLASGKTWHGEFHNRRKDGTLFWGETTISPIRDEGGMVTHYAAVMDDITCRKKDQQELMLSESRFRVTFEQAAVGMAHVATDGRWIRVNERLCEIVGYTRDELSSKSFQDITHPEDLDTDVGLMKQLLDGRIDHYALDKRYVRKGGEPIWIRLTGALVRRPDGAPDYFISVVEDIDARKRAESELKRLRVDMEQALTSYVAIQTAAAIAHELNQPLNAIASYTEAALRLQDAVPPQPSRITHALRSASDQAQRAGRVIRELIQMLHEGESLSEPIDINAVVKDAIDIVQASRLGEFTVDTFFASGLPRVRADRMQVEKVLVNLLRNGVEAMVDHGVELRRITLTITTSSDHQGMAVITVKDRGPGLTDEARRRLFEPFFSTKRKGIGMGLAISRSLIAAHGGKLWLDADADGGATFHMTLPFAHD